MKIRSLIAILFISSQLAAQVSGYMGKRLMVGYSNYFMPALIGPSANAKSSSGSFGVNTTHSFNLEFVTKSRTVFCASFQKSTTGMYPSELQETVYDGISSYYSYVYEYEPVPYRPMQINSTNIAAGFKFFQAGSLAPVGKYKKLEVLMMLNKLTYSATEFRYYDNYTLQFEKKKLGTGNYNVNSFAITYTMGRSRVLFDRMVIDHGLRIGVAPIAVFKAFSDAGFFTTDASVYYESVLNNAKIEKALKDDVQKRLFRFQAINYHIGISFLAL